MDNHHVLATSSKQKRIMNYIIDLVFRAVVYVCLFEFVIFDYFYYPQHPLLLNIFWDRILPIIIWFIMSFIIFFGFEFRFYGKTPGKFLTETRVLIYNKEVPAWRLLLKRSLWRLVPFEGLLYLFMKECLHDKFSNTIVIDDR